MPFVPQGEPRYKGKGLARRGKTVFCCNLLAAVAAPLFVRNLNLDPIYFFSTVGASEVSPVRKHWEQMQKKWSSFRGVFPAGFGLFVV
jgi:hypothetical protein